MRGKELPAVNGRDRVPLPDPGEVEDFLRFFEALHVVQLDLCNELEAIADSLPNQVDPASCKKAAALIVPMLNKAHEFESKTLWPLLLVLRAGDERLEASLERLRYEHWEDESYGEELAVALAECRPNVSESRAEAIGYMLRGFFEGLRRHIAFERDHIVVILQNHLKAGQ